jgi:hypothetical protein
VTIGCTNNDEKYKNLVLGSAEFPQSATKIIILSMKNKKYKQ